MNMFHIVTFSFSLFMRYILLQELNGLNALVIPGGESTVMIKLMVEFEMYDSVRKFGEQAS